jgi:Chitobiase/beta-hexosaminidase C-terminal domain/Bacterial Ig-like domain (group 2)
MNKVLLALIALSMGVQASATTYVVPAGSSAAAIQAIVNTAGNAAGNTVVFSAGSYRLTAEVGLPCFYGTVYTGPNVGIVTQTNLPTAILTNTVPTNFVLGVLGNGTNFTGNQGCTIQYLRFSGTQGGIIVYDPASGIVIQENAFDNNNPPAGGATSEPNIWLDGTNAGFTAATGVQHITVVWNTFFNNCAAIRGSASPDSGGRCAATWVNGYNNYLTWSDNTVNLTEEGLKLSQQSAFGIASINADVENNNMQGNSRIMIESQEDTNGAGIYSHNAFYQPFNPSYNTFELSLPQYTPSISPTHVISDDVFIGNVPVTFGGAGGHYGIGLELWGAGSIATYNLFQGGNGPPTCPAGGWCSGWQICLGGTFTNGTVINNYFSGNDVWTGTPNDMHNSLTYEESAASSNAGLIQTPNTVVQNSTTIPVAAPVIQATAGSGGSTITLSDSDTNHRLTIFYTTDGSTPTPFRPGSTAGTSKVYAAPFTIPAGTTVKTIASWGQGANQGIVFPSFGYVPSSVTALGVTPAAIAGKTMTSAYLHATANTMVTGSTLQFTAYGVYSDGSVSKLPNTAVAWGASNHKVAVISMGGHVTAMGTGVVNVQATVGTLKASYWTVTVRPTAQPSAVQPAASAAMRAAPVAAQEAEPVTAARAEASPAANEPSAPSAPAAPDAPEAAPPAASPLGPAAATPDGSSLVASAPPPAAPGKVQPDAFQGAFWRVVTPAGGSASISNSHLYLGVPGGSNHDAMLSSNQAVRVVQAIGNQNFDVTIKIDSPLFATDANTSQGLMVSSDARNFITFALQTDGTRVGLSAHTVTGGVATSVLQDSDFSQYQNPMYLRLTKSGSAYVALYSIDGINFTQAGSFTDTAAPTAVGPFASNYNDTPANAVPVVMSVNWFDVQQ